MTTQELAEMIERVRQRPGPKCKPREHGSERGYQQHRFYGTPACDRCKAAHSRHNSRRKKALNRARRNGALSTSQERMRADRPGVSAPRPALTETPLRTQEAIG